MVVNKSEVTGNTMITVDSVDLAIIQEAMWDEQIKYYALLKDGRWTNNEQERLWVEKLERLNNMAMQLGAGVLKQYQRRLEN